MSCPDYYEWMNANPRPEEQDPQVLRLADLYVRVRGMDPGEVIEYVLDTFGVYDLEEMIERLLAEGTRGALLGGPPTPTLTLVRGLPGAGKSTLAAKLGGPAFAADDFFVGNDGVYTFDPTLLPQAHAACQEGARAALARGESPVVANTFTQGWEIQPYVKIATDAGAILRVVNIFDGDLDDEALVARGLHGVPLEAVRAMRARYEMDWRAADPRPPWER